MKLIDRERRLMNRCMRRKLAWNAKLGVVTHPSGEQYIELPRAICNPSGIPNKGQKSYATKWLENRYKDLVANHLPVGWIPESVILEGMFMINVSPLGSHHTMKEYTQFLLRRYALPHFVKSAKEVHIIFDNPDRQLLSPSHLSADVEMTLVHWLQIIIMLISVMTQKSPKNGEIISSVENANET